jgi:hypothetical protein
MEVWRNSQFTYFPTSPNCIITLTINLYCRFFIQMSLDHNSGTEGAPLPTVHWLADAT